MVSSFSSSCDLLLEYLDANLLNSVFSRVLTNNLLQVILFQKLLFLHSLTYNMKIFQRFTSLQHKFLQIVKNPGFKDLFMSFGTIFWYDIINLFMSSCTLFWDVILGRKFVIIYFFNRQTEKKPVFDQ